MMDNIKNVLYVAIALATLFGVSYGAVTYFTPQAQFHTVTDSLGDDIAGVKIEVQQEVIERRLDREQERAYKIEDRAKDQSRELTESEKRQIRDLKNRILKLRLKQEKIDRKLMEKKRR